ncbi:MAG: shikimate dehydrogenase, partial [Myxococcales bacterium]|nr:shikimate dehydrogenase [Myxococcales bacterium]
MSRFALLGHPLGHSLSPVIHQAAYDALGLEHSYELLDCPDASHVSDAVARLRQGEFAGFNVTVPHKQVALALADKLDPLARQAGAANVLALKGSDLQAFNTDILALLSELGDVPRSAAVILGNGGAALGAATALRELGFEHVYVTARSHVGDRDTWPSAQTFKLLDVELLHWGAEAWEEIAVELSLVLQATSAGMRGASPGEGVASVVPWQELPTSAVAYDVVYNPEETPFLSAAREHGLEARGGLGMLVGQAAAALELWLDVDAPRAAMHEAAQRALGSLEAQGQQAAQDQQAAQRQHAAGHR